MKVTPLGVYDPIILTDEETYAFWAGECWNYLVNGEEIIFNEDGAMCPYADHRADLDPFAEGPIDETASEKSAPPAGQRLFPSADCRRCCGGRRLCFCRRYTDA